MKDIPAHRPAFRVGLSGFVSTPPTMLPSEPAVSPAPRFIAAPNRRPEARGKFLWVGDQKLILRGVTYGPFRPTADGCEYHTPSRVEADFRAMAAAGINAVRTYTVPPRWLLDTAHECGLWVMVGLPWEQHVTFLDDAGRARDIEDRVRREARRCATHPALLCFVIGNEIPAPVVRWHGARAVERFLQRLYHAVKAEDPGALVTYVNYPTTEYLRPPADFVCFNVYLESRERLEAYLARLQNLAGDRPLVMAEIGFDSLRHGHERQAEVLEWQVEAAFAGGCAGAFVFAWTDEWHRGGHDITDWAFGLTDVERSPKPALDAVRGAFARGAKGRDAALTRVSVIVCTYNGSRTLRECLRGISKLTYPNYEVIVVDDGSTDDSPMIAAEFPVRLIRTTNQGLSAARNVGAHAATGEIVAYIDDDATPDPDWLTYLVATFSTGEFAAVGGPNIPPDEDGLVADCVAHAPGGPVHVLLSDRIAEHIPGCNMAFDRLRLLGIGGFDPQFRVAGDDVDLCWRIIDRGWKIGFSPAAMVWHRRRSSVRTYFRQQRGYGRAEALLERKWPQKYNAAGHIAWGGRIYANYLMASLRRRKGRIFHGSGGDALYQSVYEPAPATMGAMLMMPEWYLLIGVLAVLTGLGTLWPTLFAAAPFLVLAIGASVVQAGVRASSSLRSVWLSRRAWAKRFALIFVMHLLQPLARLYGRLRWGLSPWRWTHPGISFPIPRTVTAWSESWRSSSEHLETIERALKCERATTLRGGDFDTWDLEIRGGVLGGARLYLALEEHGSGRQQSLVKIRPWFSAGVVRLQAGLFALALGAAWGGEWAVCTILLTGCAIVARRQLYECGGAIALAVRAARRESAG